MKKAYTKKDIQRVATEKAMEILINDKDMVLNNTSYGWNNGTCLIALSDNAYTWRSEKTIYIVLERKGLWHENKVNLAIYEKIDGEGELIEIIEKFYGIRSKDGDDLYLIDEEAYTKHQERQLKKYSEKDKHMNIKMKTSLNQKLKDRIERDIGKKIKNQDFIVRKYNKGYVINYDYRNVRKTLYI